MDSDAIGKWGEGLVLIHCIKIWGSFRLPCPIACSTPAQRAPVHRAAAEYNFGAYPGIKRHRTSVGEVKLFKIIEKLRNENLRIFPRWGAYAPCMATPLDWTKQNVIHCSSAIM